MSKEIKQLVSYYKDYVEEEQRKHAELCKEVEETNKKNKAGKYCDATSVYAPIAMSPSALLPNLDGFMDYLDKIID